MENSLFKLALIFVIVFCSQNIVQASQILQILHTNDLHSYFTHSFSHDQGGYARIKALMDKLEEEGRQKGWTTIRLDAGDFTDGNINYFSGDGGYSFQLMKMMGYDVIAVGNHEFLTGVDNLAYRASGTETRLPLVSANFDVAKDVGVKPGRIITKNGLRVAVVGATTNEILYSWMAKPGTLHEPQDSVEAWLASQNVDLRIALTHLGLDADRQLARLTKSVDIIVGGHSHHSLFTPVYAIGGGPRVVPIVQAGSRGRYLGQLLIELPGAASANIKDYKLIPINSALPEDAPMATKIAEAQLDLRSKIGSGLDTVVAEAKEDFLVYRQYNSILGNFISDAIREESKADVAFDMGSLYGWGLPQGPLMLADVLNLQPHTYHFTNPEKNAIGGWRIWKAKISGLNLKKLISLIRMVKQNFMVSGMEVELTSSNKIIRMNIGGVPVEDQKIYSFASSEGSLEGCAHIGPLRKLLPPPYEDTKILVRDAILRAAERQKVFSQDLKSSPRVIFPGSDQPDPSDCEECSWQDSVWPES